jgi:predicted permease
VTEVFEGFATIIAVIALGAFLAHIGVLDVPAQVLLSRLSFFVASPALLVTVLADTDVATVFSRNLAASFVGVAVAALLYIASARFLLHREAPETVIGALCAAYVNAGNLGLPIAAYVLGDVAFVAPVLLMQLLVLQPLALAVLDHTTSTGPVSIGRLLSRPLRTPLTVGSLVGLALALTGIDLPPAVQDPLVLVGGMAVPAMLLAYGVSLRLGPRPGHGSSAAELTWLAVLKLVVQPAAACLAGVLLGLDDAALLAVTVLSALPTAQNIFVHATRYDRGVVLARDTIFVTTVLSVPAILLITAVLAG